MQHPLVLHYLSHNANHFLMQQALKQPSGTGIKMVLQQFRKQNMSDDDIFNFFVVSIPFEANQTLVKSELTEFLLRHVKQSPKLTPPTYAYSSWGNEWHLLYFKLLEEGQPALAKEYALLSISSQRNNFAAFFSEYKNGENLAGIISFLTNKQNYNLETIQSKFSFAVKLHIINEHKYQPLIIEMAKQYLSHIAVNSLKQNWERHIYLKESEKDNLNSLPTSAAAFHFLLQYEKESALQLLQELVRQKAFIRVPVLTILEHHLGKESFPFVEMAFAADAATGGIEYIRSIVDLLQQKFEPQQFLPLTWSLVNSKSKPIRELVAKVIAEKDSAAEEKAIALLQNKNSETRQTAAIILGYFDSAATKDAVMKVLHTEGNDSARDILLQAVADNLPTNASMGFIEDMVQAAKSRGKLNKPVEAWLDESMLPPLFYTTGNELSVEEKRFLLYRMSRIKEMRSDMEAKYILQFLDKDKSADFATAIIKLYIDKAAKPEQKYLMALAALLGNDAVVDKIRITINKWMDENRYKMAEHGVGALALQGSDKALRWVEWYSRKYKSKKANVGAAALVALETAAEELGITIQELGDKVVPVFGFEGLFKNFVVDGDEYRAFIDSNFKMAFFNDDNKKLKAIPAAADATLKEEFKAIAKEVRDIVKSQSSRLEYYLIIQRKWSFTQWKKFFLQNPVMFIYATKFLWGTYNNDEQLLQTFICNEDTSLLNIDSEEINIDDERIVAMVHPSQLDAPVLQQWKQFFFDASIEAIFPQLDRMLPGLNDIDLSKGIIKKFEGKQMKEGSIRSTLEKYGWHRGPTGDGGMVESFNLLYFEKKMEAILEVEGVGAGYGWGMEEKLGRLYVIDKNKVTGRWGAHVKDDADEKLVLLKDVPLIFLNELLAAVESIKAKES